MKVGPPITAEMAKAEAMHAHLFQAFVKMSGRHPLIQLSTKPRTGCPLCKGKDADNCPACAGGQDQQDWFFLDEAWLYLPAINCEALRPQHREEK